MELDITRPEPDITNPYKEDVSRPIEELASIVDSSNSL